MLRFSYGHQDQSQVPLFVFQVLLLAEPFPQPHPFIPSPTPPSTEYLLGCKPLSMLKMGRGEDKIKDRKARHGNRNL